MKRLTPTAHTALSSLILLASSSAALAADDQLLAGVTRYESTVAFTTPESLGSDRYVDDALANLDQCITAVDAALASGLSADLEVRVHDSQIYGAQGRKHHEPGRLEEHFAPLGAVRAACLDMRVRVGVVEVKAAVDEAHAMEQALRAGSLTRDDAVIARLHADRCKKAVETAFARKIDADARLTTRYGEMSLGEVEARGCAPIAALIDEANAAGKAAADAQFAPWRQALAGDKLETFLDKNMIHFRVYTRGGKELTTPAAFARADLWFERLDSGHPQRWAMKRFQFRGDKLVGTRVVTGTGRVVPSSAYR